LALMRVVRQNVPPARLLRRSSIRTLLRQHGDPAMFAHGPLSNAQASKSDL
jgi:hypothetical protein